MDTETTEVLTQAQWFAERARLQQRVAELEDQLHQVQANMGRQLRFTEALLTAIPTPVFFKDTQGRYVGCNQAFSAQMGVTSADIQGKTAYELWPGEYADVYHQKDLELLQHPEHQVYEFKVRDKDGQARDVVFAKGVFYDEEDQVAGLVGAYVDISARVQAEQTMREHLARLTALIDHLHMGVLFEDEQRRILYTNQTFCALFGISDPALLLGADCAAAGQAAKALFADPEGFVKGVEARLAARETALNETLPLTNGRTLERDYVPVLSEGKHYGHLWLYRDVTTQVRVEEAQRLNTEQLEVLLKLNQMGQASLQEIGDFALEEAVRLTGSQIGYVAFMSDDETVLTLYSWSKTAMAACNITDKPIHYAVETTGLWGEAVRQRRPVVTNDYAASSPWKKGYPPGHVALKRHMNVPVFSDGRIVLVAGVGNKADPYDDLDVQQLTLLMEGMWRLIEHRRAAQALQDSEERFRELANLLPQVVSETDVHGNLTYANRMAFEMFGYTPEDLTQGLTMFQVLAPEEHQRAARAFQASVSGRPPEEAHEYLARRKDGSTFPALIYTSPIVRQGQITGLRGLVVDITDRKQAEQAQQQLLERVQRQQATVVALSLHPAFSVGDMAVATRFLTETVAEALNVARVSVWSLEHDATELRCRDLYLHDAATHQSGQVLTVTDFPAYFAALKQGRALDAHDAHTDPRTREFSETYLSPNGITAMLDAVIRLSGEMRGVVCLEHVGDLREWQADEITFAGEVADQMAQVLANAERRRNQEQLRAIVTALPDLLFQIDADYRFMDCRANTPEELLFPPDQVIGRRLEEILPPALADLTAQKVQQTLNSGTMQVYEYTVPIQDAAQYHEVRMTISGPRSVLALVRNITARKQTEEALKTSQEYVRNIIDSSLDMIIAVNMERRIIEFNPAAQETYGYHREEVLGQPVDILYANPEEGLVVHQTTVRQGRCVREISGRRKDGQIFPIHLSASCLRDAGGELVGVMGVSRDITERKQAEEALLTNERRWRQAQSIAKIGNWEFDLATGEIWGSEEAFNIYGIALDKTANPYQILPLERIEACIPEKAKVHQALVDLIQANRPYDLEYEVIREVDAQSIIIQSVAAQVHDAQGQLSKVSGTIQNVTTTRQMAKALRESLEKYRVLFESFPLGITMSDHAGQILEANHASEKLLGVSVQEHGQRQINGPEWRIIRSDGSPMPPAEYAGVRALTENRPVENVEMGVAKPNGDIIWLNVTAAPIPLEGYGVAMAYGDISERVQAQQALRQERDLSRALADAAAIVSHTLDPDEVLDRLLEQVSQVVPNDATNIMLIDPERRVRVVRWRNYDRFRIEAFIASLSYNLDQVPNLLEMVETGEPMVISDTITYPGWVHTPEQTWLRSYAGAPIRLRGIVIGFLSVDSATPGRFTPLHADMLRAFADHAAVALENARLYQAVQQELAAREQAETALREREAYFRALFEQASDAIFIEDAHDAIIDANQRACTMLGYTREELLQRSVSDLQVPEQRGVAGHVIQTELARHHGLPFESIDVRKDGTHVPVEVTTSPLRIGKTDLALSIVRDITERKALEAQLRRQERLAAVGQLAAGIAHDFRNLLTSIILYAQLGRRKSATASPLAQYWDIIAGESRKATDLIQQILDFSSRTTLDRHPLDLVALVGKVLTILQRTLPENIHIMVGVESGECIIEGDAGRLQQVLTNLALNARDAMPNGGDLRIGLTRIVVKPDVAPPLPEMVEAIAPPSWICLSVADTGTGMLEEVRAHLFEPFFTTKEEGKGTGLGLAQVYGIVRLHSGYIGVETAIGKGTTFRIYLPASVKAMTDSAAATSATPSGRGETLLLVEDNARLREAEQSMLTDLGYRVLTAANGREALAVYEADPQIALLITDLVMPEVGGKALCQTLHSHAPHLKALAMTGYTTNEDIEEMRAAGFLEILRKPFDADTLAQAVRRALDEGT